MKITIDGEVRQVGFWSFLKCNLLTSIAITTMIYLALAISILLVWQF